MSLSIYEHLVRLDFPQTENLNFLFQVMENILTANLADAGVIEISDTDMELSAMEIPDVEIDQKRDLGNQLAILQAEYWRINEEVKKIRSQTGGHCRHQFLNNF